MNKQVAATVLGILLDVKYSGVDFSQDTRRAPDACALIHNSELHFWNLGLDMSFDGYDVCLYRYKEWMVSKMCILIMNETTVWFGPLHNDRNIKLEELVNQDEMRVIRDAFASMGIERMLNGK